MDLTAMSCPAINKQKLPNTPGMKWEQAVLKNEDNKRQ